MFGSIVLDRKAWFGRNFRHGSIPLNPKTRLDNKLAKRGFVFNIGTQLGGVFYFGNGDVVNALKLVIGSVALQLHTIFHFVFTKEIGKVDFAVKASDIAASGRKCRRIYPALVFGVCKKPFNKDG